MKDQVDGTLRPAEEKIIGNNYWLTFRPEFTNVNSEKGPFMPLTSCHRTVTWLERFTRTT